MSTDVAHYVLHVRPDPAATHDGHEEAVRLLGEGRWRVPDGARHRDRLAPGDEVVVHVGPPWGHFVGRAVVADGTGRNGEIVLTEVEAWAEPVAMHDVLRRLPASERARADFDAPLARITPAEHAAVVDAAAR